MKKTMFAFLAAAMLASAAVQAMTKEEAEEQCKTQAAEDGVSAEEMKDYMKECVDSLMDGGN